MNENRRCIGTNRAGGRCGRVAIPGGRVCWYHGGAAPQVQAAATRRLEVDRAKAAVVTFGLPRDIDPHDALLEALHRSAGHVQWLAEKIAGFESDADLKQIDVSGKFERPSVWTEIYQAERHEMARVAKACLDAGIEERRVTLAEEQGRQLSTLIRDVIGDVFRLLTDAGLSVDVLMRVQRDQVPASVRRRLSAVMELGPGDGDKPAVGA